MRAGTYLNAYTKTMRQFYAAQMDYRVLNAIPRFYPGFGTLLMSIQEMMEKRRRQKDKFYAKVSQAIDIYDAVMKDVMGD